MAVTIRLKLATPCNPCTCLKNHDGYGRVWYLGRRELAHRVAYAEANGLSMADIKGVVIRHKCDNPPCIEPTHLLAGTNDDNVADTVQRWRTARGEKNGMAVLTEAQVREIKRRLGSGWKGSLLALEFHVSRATICMIRKRKIWAHVT